MRVRALIGLVVLISVTSTLTAPLTARPLPEPPHEPPFVASVSPNTGRIEGGDVVRLTGYGFTSPVRVFFRSADLRKEAFVISVTPSQIQIVTPQFLVAPSMQHASADIDVVIGAGTPSETLIHAGTSFTFLADSLTPSIIAVSPTSGPATGGTRVTIFGDSFQAPIRVFFGAAEAQVISISISQVVVISPSSAVVGPVELKVTNINSAKTTTSERAFTYHAPEMITAVGPVAGSDRGGTRLTIEGGAFSEPVAVLVVDQAAYIESVTPTQIIAVAPERIDTHCSNASGPIIVTDVATGEQTVGPDFTYLVSRPSIVSVQPSIVHPGGNVQIRVTGVAVPARLTVGGFSLPPFDSQVNADGSTTFLVNIPSNFAFPGGTCEGSGLGSRPRPFRGDVTYLNPRTSCTDSLASALTIVPLADPACPSHSEHDHDGGLP